MMKTCLIISALLCIALTPIPSSAATCESLSSLKLENTKITSARNVQAGALTFPPGSLPQQSASLTELLQTLPGFCRVQGVIQPSSDSDIKFEVWLPTSGWNGKYRGIGNGGFAGRITYSGLAVAIANNYATASTDTGHQAKEVGAKWALGHPEKIKDFGFRAIHETAVAAKSIIHAFYGESPWYSYFIGCSTGGRQGLMEAQRFPSDYDGIIAGASPSFYTHLLASAALYFAQAASNDGISYFNASKLPAIQEAVLAACDTLDGIRDGVLEDPTNCQFDPSKLLCSGTETDRCLTKPQLTTLKMIYEGARDADGDQILPGYSPGGEAEPEGWGSWITGKESINQSVGFAFVTEFFQNMVHNDSSWDFRTFNWDRDTKVAEDKLANILNATDPDLEEFKKRGGKLILFHGWNDAAIPALNSIDYYKSVVSQMGLQEAEEFIRLFMVPGMQHCTGGEGCNRFGQFGAAKGNPESNISAALERWVEEGVAPDKIIATKYKVNGDPTSGVERTRPLCPYPQVARYNGSGSTDEASNFVCVENK